MLSTADRGPDRKPRKSKNVVRAVIRAATNPPPRASRYLLSLIGDFSDWTTGRNAHPGTARLATLDGCNERNLRHKLRALYDGHWLDVQDGPDPGPDRVRFFDTFRSLDRRPTVWRIVLETLQAAPGELVHDGAFRACSKCNPAKQKGRVTGVATDTRSGGVTGVAPDRERVSLPTGVRVSLPTDLLSELHHAVTPHHHHDDAAGVEPDFNSNNLRHNNNPANNPALEVAVDGFLRHVLTVVQEVMSQTSTPEGDRRALVSLRKLFFPGGEVPDNFVVDAVMEITDRIDEVLTAARWTHAAVDRDGKGKPFVLGKYHRLSVLFDPAEFPAALSQAEAWEEGRPDQRERVKELFALSKPLAAEVKALVDLSMDEAAGTAAD